jgi:hypothetical protein
MEYPMPGNFDGLELHIDLKKYGLTYYWIFPHRGYASIGCIFSPQINPAHEIMKDLTDGLKKKESI